MIFGGVFRTGRQQAIAAADSIGGRILEVGVGTGISLPRYAPHCRLVGIDIADAMLEKARRRVREFGLPNVEDIAVMDAENLVYDADSFDVVVAQYVVTAVPDPEQALNEFIRVLRPGGELIITTRISADVVDAQNKRDSSRNRSDNASAEFRKLTSNITYFSDAEEATRWARQVDKAASQWAKYDDHRGDGRKDLDKATKKQRKAQGAVDKAQAKVDRGRSMKAEAERLTSLGGRP